MTATARPRSWPLWPMPGRGPRSSSRAAGPRRSPSWRGSIADAGHLVGNHSFYHARLPVLNGDGLATDVRSSEEVIRSVTGQDPQPWFRAPFGSGADRADLVDALRGLGYRHIGWHIESNEWEPGRTADEIHRSVVDGAAGPWRRRHRPAAHVAAAGCAGAAAHPGRAGASTAPPSSASTSLTCRRAWSRLASRDRRTTAPRRDPTARRGAGGRRRQLQG